jgi:type II secretion system protein D
MTMPILKPVVGSFRTWRFAGMLALVLCGCRTPMPEDQADLLPVNNAPDRLQLSRAPKAKLMDESPLMVSEVSPERAAGEKDEFRLPEREGISTPSPQIGEYPDKLIKGIKDPNEKVKVVLNFDAAPLTEIVPLFGALLNFSYLIDPGVKGAVTMTVDSEMTAREAWEMFEHVLWLAGGYASRNPGFIHVMPFAKMPQERRLLIEHDPVANVEVAFLPVYNTKSADLVANVKPFMTDGASITDIPRLNSLLIVEAPANMPKLRELLKRLDTKGEAQWPHIAVRCHQVDAETVKEELETLLPVLGFPVSSTTPSGGQIKLAVIPRLQVILVSAAMKEVLDEVKKWIRVLDKEDSAEQQTIFFYNVRHGTAEELSDALGVFFNTSGASSTKTAKTTKSSSSKAKPTTGSTAATNKTTTKTTAKKTLEDGEQETIFDTPVVVYADTTRNRLTIRTTGRAYAMVQALLGRLDMPLQQVVIQATIAEITLNKNTEFGFSYAASHSLGSSGSNTLSHAVTNSTVVDSVSDITSGFATLLQNDNDDLAFIRAVAGETNTRVLSAPQIIAASDEEAIINVGDSVPIITSGYSSATDSSDVYQNYEYQDTGIILTVTPHITAGNEVRLEVSQEVSDAVVTESSSITSPTIQTRKIETTLVVPDGRTVLLGGLIKTTSNNNHSGVPVLKDIPVLGHLFRTNAKSDDRTELLVLITVNVINSDTGTDQLTQRYKTALEEISKQMDF